MDKNIIMFIYILFAAILIIILLVAGIRKQNQINNETPEERQKREQMIADYLASQERKKAAKQQVSMNKKVISCPNCHSKNISFLQQEKKSFSAGKAAAGVVLTGGVGALAGFAGKKGNMQWRCEECGILFETKK